MNCKNCNGPIEAKKNGFVICPACGHVNISDNHQRQSIPLHARAPSIYGKRNFILPNEAVKKPKKINKRVVGLASACLGIFLVISGLVLTISDTQAKDYLNKAKAETAVLNFEKADEYLNKSQKLFAFPSTKKDIRELSDKNQVWLADAEILNQVEILIEEKDYTKAMEELKKVSKNFPDKDKITALYTKVQQALDSHALNPDNLKDKKVATGGTTKPSTSSSTQSVAPTAVPCPVYNNVGARSSVDRLDDSTDYQVHLIYVLPSDKQDRSLDTNSKITNSVNAFQSWLCGETGGKHIRMDTFNGALDISFARLSASENTLKTGSELPWGTNPNSNPYLLNDIDVRIKNLGFNNPKKIYAIYYDGTSNYSCGAGSWPPAVPGKIGAVFLAGKNPTWPEGVSCEMNPIGESSTSPTYFDFSMLHEVLHTLGFVANCSPHANNSHTTDSNIDLMYTGSLPWQPSVLDPGKDDYYGTNRSDCIDLSNSAFLVGGGKSLPPSW